MSHGLSFRVLPGTQRTEVGCKCGWWSGEPLPVLHQSQQPSRPWWPVYCTHITGQHIVDWTNSGIEELYDYLGMPVGVYRSWASIPA